MKSQLPKKHKKANQTEKRLYTLEVCLLSGPVTKALARRNKVVSHTIQIRGDQTFADLHQAIFDAFDRYDEHMYEFQFGNGPHDPKGKRHVLPMALRNPFGWGSKTEDDGTPTAIRYLDLKANQAFGYQINILAISDEIPKRKYPRVAKRVGDSPPQYID